MRHPLWSSLAMLSLLGCGMHAPAGTERAAAPVAAQREIISTLTGDPPNFAQLSNGRMMTVVSRDFGRGAKAGALVELYGRGYAVDHLWDSYVGVVVGGELTWAHQLRLVNQSIAPDTGRVESTFEGLGLRLQIEDVVPPDADVHLRRVRLTNVGAVPMKPDLAFYGYFTLNQLPTGDRLRYDPRTQALVQTDGDTAVAVASRPAPSQWDLGTALVPLGSRRDAREAVEAGAWNQATSVGPSVSGVNGALRVPMGAIAPGGTAEATFALSLATSDKAAVSAARDALGRGFAAAAKADAERWQGFLARGKAPEMPEAARAVYRRALIALEQMTAENGAIIAAPTNMNPPYRFVWPRDGSLIALTWLEAGYPEEARRFFEFCESLQQPSGGFAVNYFPDGSRPLWDFGRNGNEHDQVGMFAWGVERYYRATGDAAWLHARWKAVRKACEFLLAEQQPDGLLSRCRDLWELDTDGTWTYSNGAAWAGLAAGAAIAEREGALADAKRYREAAGRLEAAIRTKLTVDGYLARGLRKGGLDGTVEAANLALGGAWFGVMPDSDPLMRRTAEEIVKRLATPAGGIRRYENDRYYDGQPWPVATGWLAIHQLALGDRAGARARFDVMTRYAQATDALMLGEQFDERRQRWASAFPLAWSEATYVETALRLFR